MFVVAQPALVRLRVRVLRVLDADELLVVLHLLDVAQDVAPVLLQRLLLVRDDGGLVSPLLLEQLVNGLLLVVPALLLQLVHVLSGGVQQGTLALLLLLPVEQVVLRVRVVYVVQGLLRGRVALEYLLHRHFLKVHGVQFGVERPVALQGGRILCGDVVFVLAE